MGPRIIFTRGDGLNGLSMHPELGRSYLPDVPELHSHVQNILNGQSTAAEHDSRLLLTYFGRDSRIGTGAASSSRASFGSGNGSNLVFRHFCVAEPAMRAEFVKISLMLRESIATGL